MTPTNKSLTEFLLARITEDEERASSAVCSCGGPVCTPELGWFRMSEASARLDSRHAAEFVVAQSPGRVLAECAAKRRIVGYFVKADGLVGEGSVEYADYAIAYRQATLALALPYADHPDYYSGWKP